MAFGKPNAKTPQKTSSRNRGFVSKTPGSKPKPKPNATILNYFKKAADETLFIEDGSGGNAIDLTGEEEAEGEDLFPAEGNSPDKERHDGDAKEEEGRFNEVEVPVKRRKLSPEVDGKEKMPERPAFGISKLGGGRDNGNTGVQKRKTSPPSQPPPRASSSSQSATKKKARGPFLDDSSDEEEDGDDSTPPTSRPSPSGSTGEGDSKPITEGSKATEATQTTVDSTEKLSALKKPSFGLPKPRTVSRDIPLLRHETSGAILNGVNDKEPETEGAVTAVPNEEVVVVDDDEFERYEDFLDDEEIMRQFDDEEGENANDDEFFHFQDGEEFREMRYMRQQQARLDAEAEAEQEGEEKAQKGQEEGQKEEETGGGGVLKDKDTIMEECCPICSGSLAGTTADEATAHVNSCLDGNPTPLPARNPPSAPPEKTEKVKDNNIAAPEVGKRFAKAAVPRPGQANPFSLASSSTNNTTTNPGSGSAFSKLMSSHAEDAAWATAASAEKDSRGMPAYKRTCPFYKIMPGLSICVDAFRYGAVQGCSAYFLSHFHSDHYIGLTANWTHGPIYCSRVTGSLVKTQLKPAAKFVVELDFDQRVEVPGTRGVFVTMIPANHCPGSSLFLFEKTFGQGSSKRTQRILHCGDFRACPAHVNHPQLRPDVVLDAVSTPSGGGKTRQQKIDVCYLDTTYLNPRYSFPPQNDVIRACAELCVALNTGLEKGDDSEWEALFRRRDGGAGAESVSKFFSAKKTEVGDEEDVSETAKDEGEETPQNAFTALSNKPTKTMTTGRLLVVCGTYSIGKERICIGIAKALGSKIYANPSKTRICRQLNDPELDALLTSDPREAQVHMQALAAIDAATLGQYLELHRSKGAPFTRIVGFRPSGWNHKPTGGEAGVGGVVGANMPPSSLPTTLLLHGNGWRPRFGRGDLVPQRGSGWMGPNNGTGNGKKKGEGGKGGERLASACFGVPYSEHSSFRELALFLMALRIEKVVPTVNVGSETSRKRMKGWTDRWLAERRRGGVVRVLAENSEVEKGVEEEPGKEKTAKKEKEGLWDGKDGRGGGVYW